MRLWALVLLVVLAACTPDSTAGSTAPPATTTPPSASAEPQETETLLVADFGADTVTFVDPDRGAVDSVQVGTAPYGLVVGADGRAWVATAEGVAVVDTATRARIGTASANPPTGSTGAVAWASRSRQTGATCTSA
jgi:streptogramin lyase